MDKQLISFLLHRPSSWFACAQVAWAKLRRTPQVTVWREGFRIQTGTGNGEGLFCAVAGTAYEAEMKWFLQQMQPGQTFLDVGANIGIYTLHASRRLGPGGKVHAFEPTSETNVILTHNIAKNHLVNVECHQVALAEHSGILYLVAGDRPASNSTAESAEQAHSGVSIPATTLDEFCAQQAVLAIDFIKVDIEGGELAFFKGGREALLKHKPVILFESMHTGPSFPEREWLRQLGYQLFFLNQDTLETVDPDATRGANVIAKFQ
jgi:FkbM family methyltransferase